MITSILFVVSAVCVIQWSVKMVGLVMGNDVNVPMPILHMFEQSYANTYVASSAMGYQVYFWAVYAEIL